MSTTNSKRAVFSLKVVIPIILILLAAAGAYATMATAPKAKKRRPQAIQPTVEVIDAIQKDHQVNVPAMGTVVAAREITLEARVSGEVASVSDSFVPGGYFTKGETILTISPEDYELALSEIQADVTTAQYNLKVEQGYQNVSAREWDLLMGNEKTTETESELALRKPHLEKAKADLRAATAKLKQARLDLDRTTISAPFAAMIQTKSTDIGSAISQQEALATLVGTDEFWIQASVPVDRLDWITIPVNDTTQGSAVRITSGRSVREGRVVRLLPSLESEGRMARLLISVKDPLNLKGEAGIKPLLLGSYVSVEIDGGTLSGVYAIPRTAYRENSQVWMLGADGTLDMRTVNPVWRDSEYVIVEQGLSSGERVIVSDLAAPAQGLALRTMDDVERTSPATAGTAQNEKPAAGSGQGKGLGKGQGKGKGLNKEAANG